MSPDLKTVSYTVRATTEQSARWNRAAEAEGHRATGSWLAKAADAYLKARASTGRPVPLAWHRGRLRVCFEDGSTLEVRGWRSPLFGLFHGDAKGPRNKRGQSYALVLLTTGRILATLRYAAQCKALASDLARTWVKWDGSGREPPGQDPEPVLDRFRREDV